MPNPPAPLSRRRERSLGQSLVEFALIVPIFLLILAGTVDLGRLFYAFIAVENAAKEGALYGSGNPICATSSSSTNCANPENAEYRISREASNVAFDIATPYCVDPFGVRRVATPTSPTANCKDGDTYVAAVSHQFRLITPILAQVVGSGLTLSSESRATVVNSAFDPRAGASAALAVSWVDNVPTSCSDIGSPPCYDRSPRVDSNEAMQTLQVKSPTTLNLNLRVRNTSGINLTGASVVVRQGSSVITPGSCTYPASMPVGYDSGNCVFQATVAWPGSGNPSSPYTIPFTVTIDANQQEPSSDGIQVIVLEPARIAVSLQASPYREGNQGDGPWRQTPLTSASNLTVATRSSAVSSSVDPSVWYFLRIENVSSVVGRIEAFGLQEISPAGSVMITGTCTGPFGAEFTFPRDLTAGAAMNCFFERTRAVVGETTVTAQLTLAAGSLPAPSEPTATVTVQACNGDNERQVPMLVDHVADVLNGTTDRYTVAEARQIWSNRGFDVLQFSPATGSDGDRVLTQDEQAFSCGSSATDVVVTHAP